MSSKSNATAAADARRRGQLVSITVEHTLELLHHSHVSGRDMKKYEQVRKCLLKVFNTSGNEDTFQDELSRNTRQYLAPQHAYIDVRPFLRPGSHTADLAVTSKSNQELMSKEQYHNYIFYGMELKIEEKVGSSSVVGQAFSQVQEIMTALNKSDSSSRPFMHWLIVSRDGGFVKLLHMDSSLHALITEFPSSMDAATIKTHSVDILATAILGCPFREHGAVSLGAQPKGCTITRLSPGSFGVVLRFQFAAEKDGGGGVGVGGGEGGSGGVGDGERGSGGGSRGNGDGSDGGGGPYNDLVVKVINGWERDTEFLTKDEGVCRPTKNPVQLAKEERRAMVRARSAVEAGHLASLENLPYAHVPPVLSDLATFDRVNRALHQALYPRKGGGTRGLPLDRRVCIIMPYCGERVTTLTDADFAAVLTSLRYIHERAHIVHRDVRFANLLHDGDKLWLADWGQARPAGLATRYQVHLEYLSTQQLRHMIAVVEAREDEDPSARVETVYLATTEEDEVGNVMRLKAASGDSTLLKRLVEFNQQPRLTASELRAPLRNIYDAWFTGARRLKTLATLAKGAYAFYAADDNGMPDFEEPLPPMKPAYCKIKWDESGAAKVPRLDEPVESAANPVISLVEASAASSSASATLTSLTTGAAPTGTLPSVPSDSSRTKRKREALLDEPGEGEEEEEEEEEEEGKGKEEREEQEEEDTEEGGGHDVDGDVDGGGGAAAATTADTDNDDNDTDDDGRPSASSNKGKGEARSVHGWKTCHDLNEWDEGLDQGVPFDAASLWERKWYVEAEQGSRVPGAASDEEM